jgi:hypothetical protein
MEDDGVPLPARLDAARSLGAVEAIAANAGLLAYLRQLKVVEESEKELRRLQNAPA